MTRISSGSEAVSPTTLVAPTGGPDAVCSVTPSREPASPRAHADPRRRHGRRGRARADRCPPAAASRPTASAAGRSLGSPGRAPAAGVAAGPGRRPSPPRSCGRARRGPVAAQRGPRRHRRPLRSRHRSGRARRREAPRSRRVRACGPSSTSTPARRRGARRRGRRARCSTQVDNPFAYVRRPTTPRYSRLRVDGERACWTIAWLLDTGDGVVVEHVAETRRPGRPVTRRRSAAGSAIRHDRSTATPPSLVLLSRAGRRSPCSVPPAAARRSSTSAPALDRAARPSRRTAGRRPRPWPSGRRPAAGGSSWRAPRTEAGDPVSPLRGLGDRRGHDHRGVRRLRPASATPAARGCGEARTATRSSPRSSRRGVPTCAGWRTPCAATGTGPRTCCRPRSSSCTSRGRASTARRRGGLRAHDHHAHHHRRVAPAVASGTRRPTRGGGPGPGELPVEERSALLDALQELPEMQRKVVVLRHWLGLSVEESARELGISTGTVKSHSSRALERLEGCSLHPKERLDEESGSGHRHSPTFVGSREPPCVA